MPAVLYIVATPIGNLEDMTFRAVRILKEVDVIACEDTRHTRHLLDHFDIRTPAISYHEHNETARTEELIGRLREGQSVALVSDAGTPLISDPGYRIVAAAAAQGFPVVPIPGPSAAIAALSASGLPTGAFRFCGFLPGKSGQRRKAIEAVAHESVTLVFYEAPHRIVETLADLRAVLGNRPAVLARELTKVHEEFLRGDLDSLQAALAQRESPSRGEFTILMGKAVTPVVSTEPLPEAVARLERAGVPRMEAMKQVARERGLSKREVYSAVESGSAEPDQA
jgi:16S rRNA (cytidine1402-2'-O)-methyltransferase